MSWKAKQAAICQELGVIEKFDVAEQIRLRVDFIKRVLLDSGCKHLVLGISGGVDSLTAGLLCQKAVSELNELDQSYSDVQDGTYVFIPMLLPYGVQKDIDMAIESMQLIKPYLPNGVFKNYGIKAPVDALVNSFEVYVENGRLTEEKFDFVKGNVKARMRMVIQYTMANTYNGLVVGTDHAAEAVTGFFTKFGDGACDLAPLSGLVKREVREIAKALGAPEHLYMKVPTADLEDLAECKPDEDALGVSYTAIDAFLKKEDVSDRDAEIIIGWFEKTRHKRALPFTPND